jgi:hypothetical protein
VVFAVPYVQMITMFGFVFKKHDTAYKYIIIPIALIYGACELIVRLVNNDALSNIVNYSIPIATLSQTILIVVDLDDNTGKSKFSQIFPYLMAMLIQSIVFFAINVFIDSRLMNSFKGVDTNQNLI